MTGTPYVTQPYEEGLDGGVARLHRSNNDPNAAGLQSEIADLQAYGILVQQMELGPEKMLQGANLSYLGKFNAGAHDAKPEHVATVVEQQPGLEQKVSVGLNNG